MLRKEGFFAGQRVTGESFQSGGRVDTPENKRES
jgi:hypothetical protein